MVETCLGDSKPTLEHVMSCVVWRYRNFSLQGNKNLCVSFRLLLFRLVASIVGLVAAKAQMWLTLVPRLLKAVFYDSLAYLSTHNATLCVIGALDYV